MLHDGWVGRVGLPAPAACWHLLVWLTLHSRGTCPSLSGWTASGCPQPYVSEGPTDPARFGRLWTPRHFLSCDWVQWPGRIYFSKSTLFSVVDGVVWLQTPRALLNCDSFAWAWQKLLRASPPTTNNSDTLRPSRSHGQSGCVAHMLQSGPWGSWRLFGSSDTRARAEFLGVEYQKPANQGAFLFVAGGVCSQPLSHV